MQAHVGSSYDMTLLHWVIQMFSHTIIGHSPVFKRVSNELRQVKSSAQYRFYRG
jgi:hypothetical protein